MRIGGVLFLGMFVAYWRGVALLDPLFFIFFACLPAVLVGPILVERRQRNPRRSELEQLGHSVVQSCAFVYLILAVSLVFVNLLLWRGVLLLPGWYVVSAAILLGAASTTLLAALTVQGLRRFRGSTIKWISRITFLAAILGYRAMPDAIDFATERITVWGVVPASLILAGCAVLPAAVLLLRLRGETSAIIRP